MLKALPIQDKNEQEAISHLCGVVYHPECLAYKVTVDEQLKGICQFRIDDKGGHLYDLTAVADGYDFEAMFVLGRAVLNFIDLYDISGKHFAEFVGEVSRESLVKAVGFKLGDGGRYSVDLQGFFDEPCAHGHGMHED